MAFYRANMGALSATSLWTNSSPTSNFSGQSVSLSSSIANYKYIGIKYRASTSLTTEMEFLVTPATLQKSLSTANNNTLTFGARNSSNQRYDRGVTYTSNTSLTFTEASRVNTSGTNNGFCIPTKITGYK